MVTTLAQPLAAVRPLPRPVAARPAAPARDLAAAYLRYACASWRGDPIAPRFATRLSAYWRAELPPLPATPPDAVSPHGGGGRGIAWHQVGDEFRGYIPGARGGYRVPASAVLSLLRCASVGSAGEPGRATAGPWPRSSRGHGAPAGDCLIA